MQALPLGYGPRIRAAADTVPGAGDDWYPRGKLPFYRLIAMLDGHLRVKEHDIQHRLGPGQVFLQQPGHSYQFGSIARKHWCFVTFDAVWLDLNENAIDHKQPPRSRFGEALGQAYCQTTWHRLPCEACGGLRASTGVGYRSPRGDGTRLGFCWFSSRVDFLRVRRSRLHSIRAVAPMYASAMRSSMPAIDYHTSNSCGHGRISWFKPRVFYPCLQSRSRAEPITFRARS